MVLVDESVYPRCIALRSARSFPGRVDIGWHRDSFDYGYSLSIPEFSYRVDTRTRSSAASLESHWSAF